MPRRSYGGFVADWERLLDAVTAKEAELASVEEARVQVTAVLENLKAALAHQDDVLAQYRLATRAVKGFVKQGQDASHRLRNGIRMKYGTRGEELVQFGLQPFRPESRARTRRQKQREKEEKPGPVVQTDSGS